jgi:hypothetical protein
MYLKTFGRQERTSKTLEHIDRDSNFLNRTLIGQQIKEMIDKWDCIKLKSKVNSHKTEEKDYRLGENLCQLYI